MTILYICQGVLLAALDEISIVSVRNCIFLEESLVNLITILGKTIGHCIMIMGTD